MICSAHLQFHPALKSQRINQERGRSCDVIKHCQIFLSFIFLNSSATKSCGSYLTKNCQLFVVIVVVVERYCSLSRFQILPCLATLFLQPGGNDPLVFCSTVSFCRMELLAPRQSVFLCPALETPFDTRGGVKDTDVFAISYTAK